MIVGLSMTAKSGLGDIDEHANRAGLGTIGPLNVGGIAAEWKGASHLCPLQASLLVSPSPELPTWKLPAAAQWCRWYLGE